ncbi:MAG: efflux transporter periplasmic adaptor subunit [Paenibacillaceae bacterium]|jgi:HlyD family secretion protein/macrolide-specific efflux system membrane fusion protein|nr:efflux transporter periplasmic adaptor subunit [Paenibacillaceae bacterium]
MKKTRKLIKWGILGLVLIGISGFLYMQSHPSTQVVPGSAQQDIVFTAAKETLVSQVEVKGKSLYQQETMVYAPFGSRVAEWIAADGQQVQQGDVLFRLDGTALASDIAREEASIRKAELESELGQYASGVKEAASGAFTNETERAAALADRETARLNRELAEVNTGLARKDLADKKTRLQAADYRSPASGIFLYDSTVKRPHAVSDNQYIGKIVQLDQLQFLALVGEQDVFRIKPGMPVQVKLTAVKDVVLKGEVLKVSKFAKTGTDESSLGQLAQFEVIISLEQSEYLIAGLSLSGQIETERKEEALAIPTMAVLREQGSTYVMLDKGNGQTEKRSIKTGMETPEKIEVLEGLQAGDVVALP